MATPTCDHFAELASIAAPQSEVCDRCIEIGSKWVHLRSCLYCGSVGCCDNSPNRHARKHFDEHPEHPLIQSIEPGESWRYCFSDHFLAR